MIYKQFTGMYALMCSPHSCNQLISALQKDWKQKINNEVTKLLVCRSAVRNTMWLKGNKTSKRIYFVFSL